MVNDNIESLEDLSGLVRKIKEDLHPHIRWWWRGQANKVWKLHPGVYRPNFPVKEEWERIQLENHLAQDFRVESAGLIEGTNEHDKIYFLEQHYGLPTRLLDWTTNPLAALFFACSETRKGRWCSPFHGRISTRGHAEHERKALPRRGNDAPSSVSKGPARDLCLGTQTSVTVSRLHNGFAARLLRCKNWASAKLFHVSRTH